MKTAAYILFFILFFSNGKAQQSRVTKVKEEISLNFNNTQISAYQNSSISKFEQFIDYFNLLQESQDSELKNQLKENIYSLFESQEIEIADFLSANEKIKLTQFLDKYQNSNKIIKIISPKSDVSVFENSWINRYQIEINSVKAVSLRQIVSFQIQKKKFGKNSKEVWEIKLGNISVQP